MENGKVLLSITGFDLQRWMEQLSAERDVVLKADGATTPLITYAVVWKHEPFSLSRLPNLRAIFSIGAGVDHVLADPGLPDVPIVKVVAENLTQYMTEYVVWRVLDHHRQGMLYRTQQSRAIWNEPFQHPAGDISVGIMGLGHLGRSAASILISLGFPVNGWSRTERPMEGVASYYGDFGLIPFLNATDILVVLLPLTPCTRGIVNYGLLRQLRRHNCLGGAVAINAGRGKLQNETDIVRALSDGTLKEASLDVFEEEPLPITSPLWSHPNVFVTPHAAGTSDPVHLVPIMLRQMAAFERGDKLESVIDREAGY